MDPAVERRVIGGRGASASLAGGMIANLRRAAALRRTLRSVRPSMVLSFILTTNILTLLAAAGLPCRTIISERNDPARQLIGCQWSLLRRLLYSRADVVTANSRGAIETMKAYVPAEKLAFVPNPLTLECATNGTGKPERTGPAILAVGRLHEQKGYDILLAAFSRSTAVADGWRLWIAGDGPLRDMLDKQARDNNAFEVNEKKVQELRGDLEYARAQLDKQERNENALEANEKKVRELRAKLEQANKQIDRLKDKRTDSHREFEANAKQTQELRKELELARGQLDKLSEMEGTLLQADETASEIQKKISSLEFNNRALKKGTDLFLKEKAEARATISELKQTVEEIKVKVRMAEARLAQARAGEESAGEDTLSMSAIQSRDIRFQIQNEELRVKLGNQRQDLDKLQNAVKDATRQYQDLETSNKAQQKLIEELQGDIDKHNKDRADNRKSDVQISQLKAKIDEKQKMIESLQAEILNQKADGMDKSGSLDARDETQTFKLNADQLATANPLAGKDRQLQIAELKGQLAKKELSMKVVQKSLAELRNRFHKLASQERGDNTIAMPRANAFRADQTSATQASDQPDTGSDSSAEIAATVQIRRPEFD
ncbi:MAG: glycosyltransferase [Proteobacteria bacterium]|nr:glycosyltransferase [Pseudomonadota bacterium]